MNHNQYKLDPPILVIAYMHSGTTLLQQIFGRHQDVFITGGETRFFATLPTTVRKYPDLNDDQILRGYVEYLLKVIVSDYSNVNFGGDKSAPILLADFGISTDDIDELFQIAQRSRSYTTVYPIVFDFLTRKHGKRRWLDKLAGYVSQFDEMSAVLPDAQVIELVRDPRDILTSKRRRVADGWNYDPLWDSLAWKTAIRAGVSVREKHPSRVLRIRYEDLVTEPESTMRTICQFLNLQFEPQMLSVGWINSTTAQAQDSGSEISSAAVGKWRNLLPTADVAVCQQITKAEMNQNNYDLHVISPDVYFRLPVLIVRSGLEFFQRLYTKWRRGGPDLVRVVFVNYRMRLSRLIHS